MLSQEFINHLMSEALIQGEEGRSKGEVAVGAVIAHEGQIISRAHNEVEHTKDPSAHAEIIALKKAGQHLGDWRLSETVLCVTIEPCTMCIGALRLARVGTIIFGALDPRLGAVGSLYDIAQDKRLGPLPRVISGVKEEECANLMKRFFAQIRNDKNGKA